MGAGGNHGRIEEIFANLTPQGSFDWGKFFDGSPEPVRGVTDFEGSVHGWIMLCGDKPSVM